MFTKSIVTKLLRHKMSQIKLVMQYFSGSGCFATNRTFLVHWKWNLWIFIFVQIVSK